MSTTATTLSNSKVKDWRRCPYRYKLKRVDGWKPKRRAVQLERGSWIHDLLMHHYDGEDWRARHEVLTKEFYSLFEEEREELGDLPGECERLMRAYVYHYRDESWHVVETEMDELVEFPNGIKFRFIIDRIVETESGLWLLDTKTVKNFMEPDFMLLDAQLARYVYCAELLDYKPIKGVIFDEVRTKPPTVPEVLKSGELSQAKKIDTDYYTYALAIKKHGLDPRRYRRTLLRLKHQENRYFRRTYLPKDRVLTQQLMDELVMTAHEIQRAERKGEFPRTPEKTCTWDCDYLVPCQIALMGGDPSDELKAKFTRTKEKED